jgi:hypothetical protein
MDYAGGVYYSDCNPNVSRQVPERCEQLTCYKCDYGMVKAAEVQAKARADEGCPTGLAQTARLGPAC